MMVTQFVTQIAVLCFVGLVLVAAALDMRSFKIPNRISMAIVGIYPAYAFAASGSVEPLLSLGIAALVLFVGFVLFSFKLCGGGDAKLLAAIALWAGPAQILPFVLLTALAGGGMALILWIHHRFKRAVTPGSVLVAGTDPDFAKKPMPYGAAMAVGALYVALTLL